MNRKTSADFQVKFIWETHWHGRFFPDYLRWLVSFTSVSIPNTFLQKSKDSCCFFFVKSLIFQALRLGSSCFVGSLSTNLRPNTTRAVDQIDQVQWRTKFISAKSKFKNATRSNIALQLLPKATWCQP